MYVGCLVLLVFVRGASAQLQIGDDFNMQMNGILTLGYAGDYGNYIPSDHSLDFGGSAGLTGSYYSPNFLNYSVAPYYNRSAANSTYSSLTNATGVDANVNLFNGSHFPAFVSYGYTYNNSALTGLTTAPNFTTIGTNHSFAVGWSALLPNWPTFSVSYSQGDGSGTVFGTNEETSSAQRSLNLRSSYQIAGWLLNGFYTYQHVNFEVPFFLSGETSNETSDSSGNTVGLGASRRLPWNGSLTANFIHSDYTNTYDSTLNETSNSSNYGTTSETVSANFIPTQKVNLFANESYVDNLNSYFYQNLINNGSGVPVEPENSQSHSFVTGAGVGYLILPSFYTQWQVNHYDQSYNGGNFNGTYVSGTFAYNKRILNTFAISASMIESTTNFSNNSLGFIANLNAYRRLGAWEMSGNANYSQNVQTLLISYTVSSYAFGGVLHRRWGRSYQWSLSGSGSHSGFTQTRDSDSSSWAVSTSLNIHRVSMNGGYTKSQGQSLLTSTGIQPIPPTPGLLPEGLIVYNGRSYNAAVTVTPIPRLYLTGSYSNVKSDTLSNDVFSLNRTQILFAQLQYRLRRISLLCGFTRFTQGISAAGIAPGTDNSYYCGVSRWFHAF